MGILDFFKKKQKTSEIEEEPIERLEFSELKPWIKKKLKKSNSDEEKAIDQIKQTIQQFHKELEGRIAILQEVNVDEKKSQDSYKTIVKASREKYVGFLEQLFERLDNIKETELKEFIDRVNKIFLDFDKNSYKNYERTTILIGKEMVAIKDAIKVFSKELLNIFQEKREIITSILNLNKIQEKINSFESNEKELESVIEENSVLEKKLEEKEKQIKNIKKELEEIKKGKDYLENLSNKRKIQSLEDGLKKELMNLKQLIDFKAMANFFHINAGQMEMLKSHREDFQTNFQKDSGNSILGLLEEAKLNNKNILEKVHSIKEQMNDLEKEKGKITKDPTPALETQIENAETELKEIENEKEKTISREAKYEEEKQDLQDSLKSALKKVNVELK